MLKIVHCITILAVGWLTGCSQPTKTPSTRPKSSLPAYSQGDVAKGKTYYEQECEQCHKLQIGYNEKGPHLVNIYGANVAVLTDYQYTDSLKNSQIIWSSEMLDSYIADPQKTVNGTRMRSEPINDEQMRKDIIAYLSSLQSS